MPAIWIAAGLMLLASSQYLNWPDAGAVKFLAPLVFIFGLLPLGLVRIDLAASRRVAPPVLVDLTKLRALLTGLDLGDTKKPEFIEARWLNYVEWWDSRARKAKWKYLGLRGAVVIGGALIPALVGLREMKALEPHAWQFAIASIVVSLVVAICAGLDSLFGYGDIWREKRTAAEVIKSEGFSFFQLSGKYKDFKSHADAYQSFAANVEELILREIKDYIVAVTPRPESQSPTKS